MLKIILVLLIGLSNLPKTTPYLADYDQCGGIGYTGSTQCCVLSTCIYNNAWYSQCIPNSVPSTTGCSAVYRQCGGQGWTGPTCCDCSTCTYSNPWYSQCLPASSSSFSSDDAISTSAPSTTQSSTSTSSSTTQSSTSTSSSTTQSSTSTSPSTTQSSTSTSSSTTQSSTSTSSSTTQSSTSTSPSTTQSSTSTSSSTSQPADCSALYYQCGGIGWNGPTCCSESTCVYSNPWYSQCLLSGGPSGSSSSSSSGGSNTGSSTTILPINGNSQVGTTTRYWDCCKVSCGWTGKAQVTNPVETCAADGVDTVGVDTTSGCDSGTAYTCNNQQPWNVSSTLSYGYAAADISGESESDWCCACYSLIFTSGPVVGKQLIVQVTNTGGDLGNNQFDLQMPGGGFGLFNGCASQFPLTPLSAWGAQYGGVSDRQSCSSLPTSLQPGCYWRFDWFMGADNPSMTFTQMTCPSALTDNTQCSRK